MSTRPRVQIEKAFIEGEIKKYRWKETIGMFLVSFDPDKAVRIAAGEQAVVTFHTGHVSPAFGPDRFAATREPEEFVSSYCLVGGVRGNNEIIGGAFFLDLHNTSDLDALELLEIADYPEQQESEREELKQKILSARSAVE